MKGRDETARDVEDRQRASRAAEEEASGAGVGLLNLFVTTTVLDEADLPKAVADVKAAADSSKIRLRRRRPAGRAPQPRPHHARRAAPDRTRPLTNFSPPPAPTTTPTYLRRVNQLITSLALLCEGTLAGPFDGPTTTPINLDAPP